MVNSSKVILNIELDEHLYEEIIDFTKNNKETNINELFVLSLTSFLKQN